MTAWKGSIELAVRVLAVVCLLLGGLVEKAAGRGGNLWAWGANDIGQLGNGGAWSSVPVQVSKLTSTLAVSGGKEHSLALKKDGSVWAWGRNIAGQLGNGTNTDSRVPVQVSNLTGMVAISAGWMHSLALKSDGTAWAWGDNGNGQLGNGKSGWGVSSNLPVRVSNLTGVVAIAASEEHSLALRSDGTVWAWGDNLWGALGNGTNTNSNLPVQVSNLIGVVAIAAGEAHSLALKSNGTVWAWGFNHDGALGDGTNTDRNMPVQASGLSGAVAIAGGWGYSLAVKSNGTVWAWGWNYAGQLGNGTKADSNVPVQVSSLGAAVDTSGGGAHSLARKSDGTVWVWGDGSSGQLGDGTSGWDADSNVPVRVSKLIGVVAVSAGGANSLALKSDGTVWAWGDNSYGQLGNGMNGAGSNVPVEVSNLAVVATAGGGDHSLALKSDGIVWAWGWGSYGQLGNGTSSNSNAPVKVSSLAGVVAIAAGYYHSLALKSDGTVRAWGWNGGRQLGNGSDIYDSNVPVQVSNLTGGVAIAGGLYHSLALKGDGTVWAWGSNYDGQLGNGSDGYESNVPVQVRNLTGAVAISASDLHSLALKSDGTVWAWGNNAYGQLGDGTNVSRKVPVRVSNLTSIVAIAGGGGDDSGYSLALKRDGTVWAWGANYDGQLGNGSDDYDSNVPVQVSNLTGAVAIAGGWQGHSLALKNDGTVWAWGWNYDGELGNGTNTPSNVPVPVSNLAGMLTIAAGYGHSLAVGAGQIPQATLDPASYSFGNQAVGTSSAPQTITITNSGAAPLSIKGVSLQGVHPLNFTKTADTCLASTLAAGGACTISVAFTPKATGGKSAALLVTTNAPRSPHLVLLSGTGVQSAPVKVVQPNGGEKLFTGNSFRIDWTASGASFSSFDVKFSSDGGSSFANVAGCTGLAGTARNCTWATPGPVTVAGRIQVIGKTSGGSSTSDNSDANFSIVSGTGQITVTAPNTAVKWALGTDQLIKWTHNLGAAAFVKIELSQNAGATWSQIVASAPNTGTYLCNVSGPATVQGRIRVSWTANAAIKDISNVNFAIGAPFVTVTKPNGGEGWKKGSTQTVTWSSNLGSAEFVKIELSTDGGVTWLSLAEAAQAGPESTLIASTPSDGSQAVQMPAVTSTKCRVRIMWLDNSAVNDMSNANFSLIP